MQNYLFVGDTHGDLDFVECTAALARQHEAQVIQLGDWGFWPETSQIEALSAMLTRLEVTMCFVDGNHDDHSRLRELRRRHPRGCGICIAPRVIYQPRGSVHEDEEGTRFLFCGGAPSIDRDTRVAEGAPWWPAEVISKVDVIRALTVAGPVHVLVAHDAPALPPGFSAVGSAKFRRAATRSRGFVDTLIQHHRPGLHVHGHWHHCYDSEHASGARIAGLSCNQLDPAGIDDSVLLWSRTSDER